MKKLHFSVQLKAPREKVWDTMLNKETYPVWTKPFNEGGSYFKGDWSKGSKMLFIGPDPKTGEEGGMVSEVVESRPNEFISLKHVGIYVNGSEDLDSVEAKKWTPAFENYTLTQNGDVTQLDIDVNTADDFAEMFSGMWPKALEILKKMAEEHE